MELKDKIRIQRKSSRLNQEKLSELIGVSSKTIQRWESGERSPRLEEIEKIAAALGTTVGNLMGENDPEDAPPETQQRNLPINNAPENKISNDDLGLGYWGTVADNARKIAARGNEEEIALITPLLRSALKTLTGEALTVEKSARQIIGIQGDINGGQNNMNVGTS